MIRGNKFKIRNLFGAPVGDSLQGKSGRYSSSEQDLFRTALWMLLGVLLLLFLGFMITFFVTVRGAEQTLVPDVTGELLIDGLVTLQEKELYPRVQVRYTENPQDKNRIISQEPQAGSVVRAGKRIKLMISRGAVIDKVGSYTGQNLADVKAQLQTLFASFTPLLVIKEPVIFVFDDSPAGTILEQKPKAETALTGVTDLVLVVSRGPVGNRYTIDNYLELKWMDALNRVSRSNQPFIFELSDQKAQDVPLVISQSPGAGNSVAAGTPVKLSLSSPDKLKKGMVFGILDTELPSYPVAVNLSVERTPKGGKPSTVLEMKYPGGRFTYPYMEAPGTILTLKVYDEEAARLVVE